MDCYQDYFASLLKRATALQTFEGQGQVNLEKFEFLCPTVSFCFILFTWECRRLSNGLLPIMDTPINSNFLKSEVMHPVELKETVSIFDSNIFGESNKFEESLSVFAEAILTVQVGGC